MHPLVASLAFHEPEVKSGFATMQYLQEGTLQRITSPPGRCAFCQSLLLRNDFRVIRSTSSAFASSSFTTSFRTVRYRAARQQEPIAQKRRRSGIANVQCTFGNNSNNSNEKFMTQVADVLIGAGRFFQSTTGQVVLWGSLVWFVLTGRIGFLFDSFVFLFALVSIVPVVAMLAFRWWINRQLVQGTCPSCGATVTGLRNQPFRCMTCGNTVQSENKGDFSVKDPSSATIDIDAKEIDDL